MRTIKLSKKFNYSSVATILKKGGVIIYPTETAYGLGGDATSRAAVKKIYQIKGRNFSKPLPLITASLTMAKRYAKFPPKAEELAKRYWPGPLTLVLPIVKLRAAGLGQNANQPSLALLPRQTTIALRVSSNKFARRLSDKLNRPIIATSANLSGQKPTYSAQAALRQLKVKQDLIDLVIDAGRLPYQVPTTIIGIINDKIKILRQGSLLPSLACRT